MAIASPRITAECIEATEFPELSQRYRVMAVPKIVINDAVQFEGAIPEKDFLGVLLAELPVARVLLSLGLLYAGLCLLAYLVSDRMIFLAPPATYRDSGQILRLTTADGVQISAVHLVNPPAEYTL